ncbi:MAG: hypothetical protein IT328_12245 [Caldilineaceae bacterium]|nr:hypothetical protein [Caldilineaceae bacterium]
MAALAAPIGNVVARCALCGLWLVMPIPVAGVLATLANWLSLPEEIAFGIFSIGVIVFYTVAGAMWARNIGRVFGWQPLNKLGFVGAVGITLPTVIVITVLGIVEQNLLDLTFDGWRMHILFGLLFVPAAFLIAATGTGALGLAIGDWRLALRLALVCGLTAALTFLVVTVLFDLAGMRVGAPRAEERATMLVVTLAGMWAAGLTGNAMLGWMVERWRAA